MDDTSEPATPELNALEPTTPGLTTPELNEEFAAVPGSVIDDAEPDAEEGEVGATGMTSATDAPVGDVAEAPAALVDGSSSSRPPRHRRPLWVGVAAGVAGLALGLGGTALIAGDGDHGDRGGQHLDKGGISDGHFPMGGHDGRHGHDGGNLDGR